MKPTKHLELEIIEEKKIIISPIVKFFVAPSIKIRQIELSDEYLRIDFIHSAGRQFINGGWVRIMPGIFIRPQGTTLRLPLMKVECIPAPPKKHYYKSGNDRLFFSLYFPAISKTVEFIDIVEKEGGDNTYFNFYGVSVQAILKRPIVVHGIEYSIFDN